VLNSIWKLDLSMADIHKTVSLFGSDINFFLENSTALLKGRGEIVRETFPSPHIENILLVNPGIEIASRNAYSWLVIDEPHEKMRSAMITGLNNNDVEAICKNLHNGLEQGVFAHYPILQKIKAKLLELGAMGSLMSGSGATVFGIFPSREKLLNAKKYFKNISIGYLKPKLNKKRIKL
jgi:4-diphosphocytidyl-2C-methyl-D-erythritol 2-phosphate synthase